MAKAAVITAEFRRKMLMEVIDGFKIVPSVQIIVVNFGKKVVVGDIQIPYRI
ncbi:MAG: hypothetical protein ACLS9G_03495 [Akkermansia sp.]